MTLRRIISVVLTVCLLAAFGTVGAAASAGHVYSVVDIVRVAKAIATQTQLSDEEMALYDTNGDGILTIADVVAVAEYVVAAQEALPPTVQQPSPQPTMCPTCGQYPCVCSSGTIPDSGNQQYVCAACGQYPCVCGSGSHHGWGTQNRVCATCGQYPCVCGSGSHGWGTQNRVCATCGQYPCVCGSGSHHGWGHHSGGHC